MTVLRSLVFQMLFFGWTALIAVLVTPLLLAPRRWMQYGARTWVGGCFLLMRWIVGLRLEVRGAEYMPREGAALVVCKHQSMWDTLVFHHVLPDPNYILKKELAQVPFFGWAVMQSGCVAVDRGAGARALRQMAEGAKAALQRGSQVIIFPEGTRTAPGARVPYHSGVALLTGLGVPVIPAALNSGLFWRRHTFLRPPGTIVLEFLPPLPSDLDRKTAMRELESRIEAASRRLLDEALAHAPHLAASLAVNTASETKQELDGRASASLE